eukprot:CAMPEP_0117047140 /NCGR_PEP_ID=MMETSP0472-20121206/32589_1 /TAXON_ID=693140 ORGANISM="Tiarina fusus, Strain LIS" /NCGR_SAMPLE_ID=MMETSP0472 /ASSEMBLY_ACC=CAM_ASM_000603 /LENGTH=63 /DNA_ID=CAMNT_0004759749 /DNA_START=1 /DNA_END=192 /DNA_ORIENTATION=+
MGYWSYRNPARRETWWGPQKNKADASDKDFTTKMWQHFDQHVGGVASSVKLASMENRALHNNY